MKKILSSVFLTNVVAPCYPNVYFHALVIVFEDNIFEINCELTCLCVIYLTSGNAYANVFVNNGRNCDLSFLHLYFPEDKPITPIVAILAPSSKSISDTDDRPAQ